MKLCTVCMLPNQTWVHLSTCNKTDLLRVGCGEGKCSSFWQDQGRSPGQQILKMPEVLDGFQDSIFKGQVRE